MSRISVFWLTTIICLILLSPRGAPAQQKAGVVSTLRGQATIARANLPAPARLNFRDDVFFRDRIATERDSLVKVLLGGKALLTVRELSDVEITEEPNRAQVNLGVGRLALQLLRRLMRPGESVEIVTPNAVAAVRGSFVVVACKTEAGVPQCDFVAVDVSAPVSVCDRADPNRCVSLGSNQIVRVTGLSGATTQTAPQDLPAAEAGQWVGTADAGLLLQSPPENLVKLVDSEMLQQATLLAQLLTGGSGPAGDTALADASAFAEPRGPQFRAITPTMSSTSNLGVGELEATLGGTAGGRSNATGTSTPGSGGGAFPEVPPDFKNFPVNLANVNPSGNPDVPVFRVANAAVQGGAFSLLQVGLGGNVTINSTLLDVEPISTVSTGGSLLEGGDNGTFTNTSSKPVFVFNGSSFTGGTDAVFLTGGAKLTTGGPFLTSTNSALKAPGTFLVLAGNGTTMNLGGSLLTSDGGVNFDIGLLSVLPGAQLAQGEPANPLVSLTGGTNSIGNNEDAIAFELRGRTTGLDQESGLVLGTDTPLQLPGSLLQAAGGTRVTGATMVVLDTALLSASAPLLNILGGSSVSLSADAVNLVGQANLTVTAPSVVRLDGSTLTMLKGADLFTVASGSKLKSSGDLLILANKSTLTIVEGTILNILGGSFVSIGGAFLNFVGAGNTVNITNSFCNPCQDFGGVHVSVRGGAAVDITNPIKGTGTINRSNNGLGAGGTADIVVNGGKLVIKGL